MQSFLDLAEDENCPEPREWSGSRAAWAPSAIGADTEEYDSDLLHHSSPLAKPRSRQKAAVSTVQDGDHSPVPRRLPFLTISSNQKRETAKYRYQHSHDTMRRAINPKGGKQQGRKTDTGPPVPRKSSPSSTLTVQAKKRTKSAERDEKENVRIKTAGSHRPARGALHLSTPLETKKKGETGKISSADASKDDGGTFEDSEVLRELRETKLRISTIEGKLRGSLEDSRHVRASASVIVTA